MKLDDLRSSPIGIDAPKWATRAGCRTALTVVHTLLSGQRLLDVVAYIESDPWMRLAFAPDAVNHAVPEFLRGLDAQVLPWAQATRERFDLAPAAAYGGLDKIHAPLVVLPQVIEEICDGSVASSRVRASGCTVEHTLRGGRG